MLGYCDRYFTDAGHSTLSIQLEFLYTLALRKRNELLTTKIELNAIAPAANMGVRKPNAAAGIRMML